MSMSQPLGSKHKTGKEPLKCYIVRPVQSILFCFLINFENDFLYRLFQKCQNRFPREVLDILIGEPFLCGQQSLRYGREAKIKKKVGVHFYFSTRAFFIASVDLPFKKSTDPGLMKPSNF